jgi:hypothetical protein
MLASPLTNILSQIKRAKMIGAISRRDCKRRTAYCSPLVGFQRAISSVNHLQRFVPVL